MGPQAEYVGTNRVNLGGVWMPEVEISGVVELGKLTMVGRFAISITPIPSNSRKFFIHIIPATKRPRVRHRRQPRKPVDERGKTSND